MLRLFSSHKTTLMFVIRDKTRTPLENLEPVLREDIQKIWDSVPKPEAYRQTPLSDLIILFPHDGEMDGENKGSEDHQSSPAGRVVEIDEHELGLFAIYDGHLGDRVSSYLQKHLFDSILNETDEAILSHDSDLGSGGSTLVTAVLINGQRLWVANLGHSRAVLLKGGEAIQMSTDYEPTAETVNIAHKGVFVSNMPVQMMPKISPKEEICLRYRCLDLRRPQMSSNIMLTHQIETPILSRLTLEGTGDYLVPSRVQY
ncbi:hypothetical protein L2E82_09972 [Cichorium intybus]|uniref:Uncharacterized protein n=1 Tax=Cichorium intybus TaxID=13427 RepID=A0ACB9GBI9_CICIN|nr:hypothetical protein L2E82_09972 [Cichorium intybus]